MALVMVLADGVTYTGLDDCKIVRVPDDKMEDIESGDASVEDFQTNDEGTKVLVTFDAIGRRGAPAQPCAGLHDTLITEPYKQED